MHVQVVRAQTRVRGRQGHTVIIRTHVGFMIILNFLLTKHFPLISPRSKAVSVRYGMHYSLRPFGRLNELAKKILY